MFRRNGSGMGEGVASAFARQSVAAGAAAIALVAIAFIVVHPYAALESARRSYAFAAGDCLEARSMMAELETSQLSNTQYLSVYRSALVPAMACLEKSRIESWLRTHGVGEPEIRSLELDVIRSAKITLEYLTSEIGVQ